MGNLFSGCFHPDHHHPLLLLTISQFETMLAVLRIQTSFSLVLLLVVLAASLAIAMPQSNGATLSFRLRPLAAHLTMEAPISSPSTGTDAKSIIAASSHSMGTSDDSTNDDDAKDPQAGNTAMGGHNGQWRHQLCHQVN